MLRVCVLVTCAALLGGCGWVGGLWPWGDEEPQAVTVPQASVEPTPTTAPATAPATPAVVQATRVEAYEGYQLTGQPRVIDALMLQIDNEIITVSEVILAAAPKLRAIPASVSEEQFRLQAQQVLREEMRSQIVETLVQGDARRELHEQEMAQIEAQLVARQREWTVAAGGSRTGLDQKFRSEGSSLQDALNVTRRQLISQHYIRSRLLPRIAVSRGDMWRYYQQNPAQFSSEPKVRMQVLALPDRSFWPAGVSNATPAQQQQARQAALEQARTARQRVEAGEAFEAVVREMGRGYRAEEGGLWDLLPAGSFREAAVEQAAFAQAPGQLSEPIEGETGVFLVKTVELQPGTQVPFEQAQQQIEELLRQQQYQRLQANMLQDLYMRATLVPADQFESRILDRAVSLYHQP